MVIRPAAFLLIAVVLGSLGCASGDECDRCDSDDDCRDGLACAQFNDGQQRCASGAGATRCRDR